MSNQPGGLIQVLLDEKAEYGDRHDAAMDLAAYDAEEVEDALASVACDPATDVDLAEECGASLAEVWCHRNVVTKAVLMKLTPSSLPIAMATLRARSPSLAADAESVLSARA